jgi:sugar phosphate permease
VRDPAIFTPLFFTAFFFLSWYNGPLTAVIFDVVPARVGATVAGTYLLFIHLAGDAIAFPLVGFLSDNFGIDRAVFVLPVVALLGGIVMLGAMRTVGQDMVRADSQRDSAPSTA